MGSLREPLGRGHIIGIAFRLDTLEAFCQSLTVTIKNSGALYLMAI